MQISLSFRICSILRVGSWKKSGLMLSVLRYLWCHQFVQRISGTLLFHQHEGVFGVSWFSRAKWRRQFLPMHCVLPFRILSRKRKCHRGCWGRDIRVQNLAHWFLSGMMFKAEPLCELLYKYTLKFVEHIVWIGTIIYGAYYGELSNICMRWFISASCYYCTVLHYINRPSGEIFVLQHFVILHVNCIQLLRICEL